MHKLLRFLRNYGAVASLVFAVIWFYLKLQFLGNAFLVITFGFVLIKVYDHFWPSLEMLNEKLRRAEFDLMYYEYMRDGWNLKRDEVYEFTYFVQRAALAKAEVEYLKEKISNYGKV